MNRGMKMIGRIVVSVSVAVALLGLAACNTVAGAGRDITDSAQAVKRAL
jgi:predicted small secreted protein